MYVKKYFFLQKKIDHQLKIFFDKKIKEAQNFPPFINKIIKEQERFVINGGKRIRPILLYYGYLAAGGKNKKVILDASIFVELIHSYLLVHDDIIDQDDIRRGKLTIHRRYESLVKKFTKKNTVHLGISFGIVAGDMLSEYGYEILAESKFSDDKKVKALQKLNTILCDVIIGQELDIFYSIKKSKITLRDILQVLEYKTGKYTIEGPLHLGAILAGADQKTIKVLSEYAIPLGIAFQIQDDILGIFGNRKETGKSIDSDIKQNKQTLLIFQARKWANSKQRKIIEQGLGNQNLKSFQLEKIRNIVRETKSLEYAQKLSRKLANQSKSIIEKSHLKKEAKVFFIEFASYIIERAA